MFMCVDCRKPKAVRRSASVLNLVVVASQSFVARSFDVVALVVVGQHIECGSLLLVPTNEKAWSDVRIEEFGVLTVVVEVNKLNFVLCCDVRRVDWTTPWNKQ